jgi:hypothetical protein
MNILAAPGPGSKYRVPGARPAGFWAGFWHGIICPFTFLVSAFTPNVRFYEARNRGRLYDLGFYLGFASLSSSSAIHQAYHTANPPLPRVYGNQSLLRGTTREALARGLSIVRP